MLGTFIGGMNQGGPCPLRAHNRNWGSLARAVNKGGERRRPPIVHSTGPTGVSTRPMSYKPSPSNGLSCMVTQNTIVGRSSVGGQLRQGVRSNLWTAASAKSCLDHFGVPARLGTLRSTLSRLISGATRGNYSLVNDTAFARDPD